MIPEELDLVPPVPRTRGQSLRRQLLVLRHGLRAWALAPGWLAKLILTALSVGLIAYPLAQLGWKYPVAYSVVWVLVGSWKAYRELSPKNIQLVQRNYLTRKLMLYRLVREMERAPSLGETEITRYQEDVLALITNYARDHRGDIKGNSIFASLVVEDGSAMRVVVRNQAHRETSMPTPKWLSLAWKAVATGEPQITGDLYAEYPDMPPGKPYRSVLAMPIRRGDRVLGAVCIDSSRRYHFDREFRNLVEYLRPYVALLAWTLDASWRRVERDVR